MTTFSQLEPDPSSGETTKYWKLSAGVQLLGEFDGPAFEQRPGLVRRGDGQVIQISPLLYALAESLDGNSNATLLAELVSSRLGRQLSSENVDYLVEHRLGPLGIVGRDFESPVPTRMSQHRSKPLLALRFRSRLVPERAHREVTLALRPLFHPLVIVAVLGLLVTLDVVVAETRHVGVAAATLQLANHPALLLLVTALLLASAAFHEIGHATAARYGGATPGVMGVGIYLVWPVFYTDLSDVYRLGRRSRIRADLGGVYFNAILITIADGVFVTTHYAPLLVFIVLAHVQLLYQFMPFVRMDGYWILSDLVGVPNLFAYIGPVLASMRGSEDPRHAVRLARIRPWARRVISSWVVFTIAILGVNATIIVLTGPRILTTDLVACHARATALVGAFERANVLGGINDLVAFILLAVPGVGILVIAWLLTRRAARLIVSWWPHHRTRATALGLVSLAALGTFAFKFVPNDIARPLMGRTGGSFFAYRSPALALPRSPSTAGGSSSALTTTPPSEQVAFAGASADRQRPSRSATSSSVDHAPTRRTPSQATPPSTTPPSTTVPTVGAPTTGSGAAQTGSPTGSATAPTTRTPSTRTGSTGVVPTPDRTGLFALPITASTTIPETISSTVSALLPAVGGGVSPTSDTSAVNVAPVSVTVSATTSPALPPVPPATDTEATSTTIHLQVSTPTPVVASASVTLSTGAKRGTSATPAPTGADVSTSVSATVSTATSDGLPTGVALPSMSVSTTVAAQVPTTSKSADDTTTTTTPVEPAATISKTVSKAVSNTVSASVSATTPSGSGSSSKLRLSL